jgi:hypothetical protein
VRRLVPWALLAVLLVGLVAGAVIGQVGAPSASTSGSAATAGAAGRWVDELLASTRAARSAHFSYTSVSRSPIAVFNSRVSGRGVVDFAGHRVSVTELQSTPPSQGPQHAHQLSLVPLGDQVTRTVSVGKSTWTQVGGRWLKIALPANPYDRLGLSAEATAALIGVEGIEPVGSIRRLGPADVGGVPTTRYQVTTARPRPCNARQAAALRGNYIGPTDLWVDGRGRLVQATLTTHADLQVPASLRAKFPSDVPTGPMVSTSTLRLGHFGVPVKVVVPSDVISPPGGRSIALSVRACH